MSDKGDGYWSWTHGEQFPRFKVCRGCKVYYCDQWDGWKQLPQRHSCRRPWVPVASGHSPPPHYEPGLGPLELLAAVATSSEWDSP